jgi:mRNA-degrading endonuclease RelE of RelBE toxin-antitoxin system
LPQFTLKFTPTARKQLKKLEQDKGLEKRLKAVRKTLALLETNLHHPSLNIHDYASLKGARGEKVFEAYAESRTPAAYRVFWHYGPAKGEITVLAITPHP